MRRSFIPPSTMSQADVRAVADVRRALWTGGFTGLGTGLCLGTSLHLSLLPMANFLKIDLKAKPKEGLTLMEDVLRSSKPLSKNHRVLFALVSGAAFSYLGAITAGNNEKYKMQHVYQLGAHRKLTPYEQVRTGKSARPEERFGAEEQDERELHDFNVRESVAENKFTTR